MPRHGRSSQPEDDYYESPPPPRVPDKRKPLIRLACPSCGGIVSVNALDRAGTTENTCGKCAGTIWVETDDDGAIAGIEGQAKEQKKTFEGDWRVLAAVGAVVLLVAMYLFSLRSTPLNSPQTTVPLNQSQTGQVP